MLKNVFLEIDGIEFPEINGIEEANHQKGINDKWKDEMNILQSPISLNKKFVKEDEGYQKLEDLGQFIFPNICKKFEFLNFYLFQF